MLMPRKVKYRKQQRGKMNGNATRGNYVAFGDYGLQSLETCWVSGRQLEAARLVTWQAAWLADQEKPNAKEASMSKAMGGQAAIRACIEAIEICGVEGTLQRDHQLLEKWFRDIKVYDIFEGTGQIQRIVIAKRLFEGLKSF